MRPMLHAAAFVAISVFGLVESQPASADETLLVRQGRQLAETWCASCHVIGTPDQISALTDAPPFPTLAKRPDFDDGDLAAALYRPHPAMPSFDIGREDIRALTAFIRSLTTGDAPPQEQRTEVPTDQRLAESDSNS